MIATAEGYEIASTRVNVTNGASPQKQAQVVNFALVPLVKDTMEKIVENL